MSTEQQQGDLVLTADGRGIALATGIDALAQKIRAEAQIFKGQFVYDRRKGIDYFGDLAIKGVGTDVIAELFRRWLLAFEGIERIKTLTVTIDRVTRSASVHFVAETTVDAKPLSLVLKYGD